MFFFVTSKAAGSSHKCNPQNLVKNPASPYFINSVRV